MRPYSRSMNAIRMIALLAVALLASSCSRSLPTAPTKSVVRNNGADAYLTAGLENQAVVTINDGVDPAQLAAQYGAAIVRNVDGSTVSLRPIAGQTTGDLMTQLGLDGRIVCIEPNSWLIPAEARQQSFAFDDGFGNATTYAEQPAAAAIGLDRAQEIATGRGVKVAILDTGADMHHPVLRRSIVDGWDFVNNDADPTDERDFINNDGRGGVDDAFGHGTHVAGIVHLVAPNAQLLIVRVLDDEGRGDIVNVVAGVRWAIDHGAKVINLSLGTIRNVESLQHALEEADAAGVIVVAAIGNWGPNPLDPTKSTLDFPGFSSHAFGIAAVDADGNAAPFSSFNHSDVLISAPGIGVRSTYPGGGYRLWNGTSMSAPFVAGTAALLAEKHPLWTMDLMRARLEGSATPLKSTPPLVAAREYGAGMLNAGRALEPDFVPGPNQDPSPEDTRQH